VLLARHVVSYAVAYRNLQPALPGTECCRRVADSARDDEAEKDLRPLWLACKVLARARESLGCPKPHELHETKLEEIGVLMAVYACGLGGFAGAEGFAGLTTRRNDMADVERILIVGGGIAGLSLATALHNQGYPAELVERRAAWPAVGAGGSICPRMACAS
jgi:hypothetical protein